MTSFRDGEREVVMLKSYIGLVCIGFALTSSPCLYAESTSREVCSTGVVGELNQSLQEEALDLKGFLETRKQTRLSGRDKVEACSRWSAMNSYAKSMSRHYQNVPTSDPTAAMVEHLKSDLKENNDCWTNPNPTLANMLEGVRIVISRAARIGDSLLNSEK